LTGRKRRKRHLSGEKGHLSFSAGGKGKTPSGEGCGKVGGYDTKGGRGQVRANNRRERHTFHEKEGGEGFKEHESWGFRSRGFLRRKGREKISLEPRKFSLGGKGKKIAKWEKGRGTCEAEEHVMVAVQEGERKAY